MTAEQFIGEYVSVYGHMPPREELWHGIEALSQHGAAAALKAYQQAHPEARRAPPGAKRKLSKSDRNEAKINTAPEVEQAQPAARYMPSQASNVIPYKGEDGVFLVFSDVHFPFQDKEVVKSLLWFARLLKPDGIIANGDLLDFYELSRFSKDPRRKKDTHINTELRQCRDFLKEIAQASGARWKVYHKGNHEVRLESRLCERLPELSGLEMPDGTDLVLTVEYLLGLADLGWAVKEYRDFTTLGDLDVEHGSNVSKPAAMPSGQTIRNVLIRRQRSTMMGHIHTQAHTINTARGEQVFHGLEIGCLCDLKPEYDPDARWSHGWAVVTVKEGRAYPELVQVRNGRAFWRGELL